MLQCLPMLYKNYGSATGRSGAVVETDRLTSRSRRRCGRSGTDGVEERSAGWRGGATLFKHTCMVGATATATRRPKRLVTTAAAGAQPRHYLLLREKAMEATIN